MCLLAVKRLVTVNGVSEEGEEVGRACKVAAADVVLKVTTGAGGSGPNQLAVVVVGRRLEVGGWLVAPAGVVWTGPGVVVKGEGESRTDPVKRSRRFTVPGGAAAALRPCS